jgi:hypothetical protein
MKAALRAKTAAAVYKSGISGKRGTEDTPGGIILAFWQVRASSGAFGRARAGGD